MKMVLAGFIIWGGLSCTTNFEEEGPLEKLSSGVQVIRGTLKIDSFDQYEQLITGQEKIGDLAFVNFQENFNQLINSGTNLRISQEGFNEITQWEGSLLLELLDKDGFVILEDYLIYLNFNNRTAVVSTDLSLKEQIVAGAISSEDIRLFSFDDDVIGLLDINSPSTVSKSGYNLRIQNNFMPLAFTVEEGCGWSKCDNSQYFDDPLHGDVIGLGNEGGEFRYRLDAKHTYQAAAISFKLFTKVKHMRKPETGSLFWTPTATTLKFWYDYELLSKRRRSTLQKASSDTTKVDNVLQVTFHDSSRGLERFYLRTQFYAQPGGSHGYSPTGRFWQGNLRQIDKGY